jgi:hypothetical protein
LLRIGQQAGGLSLFNKRVRSEAKIAALPSVHPKLKKARVGFQPTPKNERIYVSCWRRGSESNLQVSALRDRWCRSHSGIRRNQAQTLPSARMMGNRGPPESPLTLNHDAFVIAKLTAPRPALGREFGMGGIVLFGSDHGLECGNHGLCIPLCIPERGKWGHLGPIGSVQPILDGNWDRVSPGGSA